MTRDLQPAVVLGYIAMECERRLLARPQMAPRFRSVLISTSTSTSTST